jgi:predicted TPR repeat methyltransferase
VAAVCARLVDRNARILDAGAGTGLLGVALAEDGFSRIDALDLSPAMLAVAERKGIYDSLVEARLGAPLPYDAATFDAVVSSGVLTTGHAPASSLDELVRITRPGGHVVGVPRGLTPTPARCSRCAGRGSPGRVAA